MKKIALFALMILIFLFFLSGCIGKNVSSPNLVVDEIRKEISYEGVPLYIGYVKNVGDATAKYSSIEIEVFANEDKNSHIAIESDYMGTIASGERDLFRVYLWGLASLTDISNYKVNLKYE